MRVYAHVVLKVKYLLNHQNLIESIGKYSMEVSVWKNDFFRQTVDV